MPDGQIEVELRMTTDKIAAAMQRLAENTRNATKALKSANNEMSDWRKKYADKILPGPKNINAPIDPHGTAETLTAHEKMRGQMVAEPPSAKLAKEAMARFRREALIAEQKRHEAAVKAGSGRAANIPGLAGIINSQVGIGQGGQAPGYKSFWQSAVPPTIPTQKTPIPKAPANHGVPSWMLGIAGRGGMGSFGPVVSVLARLGPIAAGVTAAFIAARIAVRQLEQAFQHSASQFARAMMQHKPMDWSVTEGNMASIMGVSADSVRQFGQHMAYLANETRISNRELTRATPTLTAVTWHWRSMMLAIHTSWALLAEGLSRGINKFLELIRTWNDFMNSMNVWGAIGEALGAVMELLADTMKVGYTIIMGVTLAFVALFETMQAGYHWILNHIPGMKKVDTSKDFQTTKDIAGLINDMWSDKKPIPNATASADRLKSDTWANMGFITGAHGGGNPAERTAKNTTRMVSLLEKMTGGASGFQIPNITGHNLS